MKSIVITARYFKSPTNNQGHCRARVYIDGELAKLTTTIDYKHNDMYEWVIKELERDKLIPERETYFRDTLSEHLQRHNIKVVYEFVEVDKKMKI